MTEKKVIQNKDALFALQEPTLHYVKVAPDQEEYLKVWVKEPTWLEAEKAMNSVMKIDARTQNVDIDINEDSIFSSVETEDLSNFTGIEIKKMRGVVGSLIKKGIVYLEDYDDDGTEIIYLDNEYFYLSNESK